MDGHLSSEIARHLETSIPRVQRAIKRLQLSGRHGRDGHVRFSDEEVDRLRGALGVTPPIAGLSSTQVRVLAALARAPLGIASMRALAGRASVSPTAASRAVTALVARGLVLRETQILAAGTAQALPVVRAHFESPQWAQLTPALTRVIAPQAQRAPAQRVPRRLRHIFWNSDPAQLHAARAGGYIARRLLTVGDLEGLAWGATVLRAEDWEHAARTRGLAPPARALAHNLARDASQSR